MAATNRLFVDLFSGVTDADPGAAGTSLSSPALADLPEVADPDFIALTLDPEEEVGEPEIVWVTAHTTSATTATILRAQEGTSARAHTSGTKIIAPLTKTSIEELFTTVETAETNLAADIAAAVQDLEDAETALNNAAAAVEDVQPVGAMLMWPTGTAPDGWYLCNGDAISRATYSALFAVLGETYGVGDGATTFNVPDFRDRAPYGAGTDVSLAEQFGDFDHVHTGPSHTHTGPSHTHTMGTHTHSNPSTDSGGSHSHTVNSHTHSDGTYVIGNTDGAHTHSFSDSFTTGTESTATTIAESGIGSSGLSQDDHTHSGSVSGTTGSSGVHGHGFAGSSGATAPGTDSQGAHTHTQGNTGATDPGDTNAAGTGSTGAGGTGNTGAANPPGLGVNFIIRTGV